MEAPVAEVAPATHGPQLRIPTIPTQTVIGKLELTLIITLIPEVLMVLMDQMATQETPILTVVWTDKGDLSIILLSIRQDL